MMETRGGYMLVGIFVLLSLAGIFGFFLWLAKNDLEYKVKYYTIFFPGSVTGLTIGGAVDYLGVPVGTVKDIELDTENLNQVQITVAIKEGTPITEDTYASLELQGLTGYKFVQLYGGGKDSPLLKAKPGQIYPIIPSRYSDVEEVMTTLPNLVNKFTNLVDRLSTTFNDENKQRFSEALKNIDAFSQQLAKSAEPLKNLITDTHKAMKTLDKEIHDLSEASQKTLTKVDLAAQDIAKYLKENQTALDTLTQTGSYELLQTLNDTREMITSATRFFEKLDKNPRSLFFQSPRTGISVPQ